MDEGSIQKAWHEIDKLCGPDYYGRDAAFKKAAQEYSILVLDSNSVDRINRIGMKHLKLAANGLLDGKQFSLFLQHIIEYER